MADVSVLRGKMGRGAAIPDRDRGMSDSRQSGSDHAPPRYAVVVYAEDSVTFEAHHPGRNGGNASNRGEIGRGMARSSRKLASEGRSTRGKHPCNPRLPGPNWANL